MSEILTLLKIIRHRDNVGNLLKRFTTQLELRSFTHDLSKFELDEFVGFCELDARRSHSKEVYGSKSYEAGIKDIDAVKLHQSRNSHHLEYHPNGLDDMSLGDVVEMLIDWEIARRERDAESDIEKTWQIRQQRFGLTDYQITFLRDIWERMEKDLI